MAILVSCPRCGQRLNLLESILGKTVRCPKCQNPFKASPPPAKSEDAVFVADLVEDRVPLVEEVPPDDQPRPWDERDPDRRQAPAPKKGARVGLALGIVAGVVVLVGILAALIIFVGRGLMDAVANRPIPASEWQPYRPPDGRFTILIPGRPSLGLRTGAASSQINVRRYSAALPHYQRTFIAAFVPPGQFPEQEPNPLMALARAEVDTLVNQSAGKLLEERDLPWNGLQAREIVMELSEKRIVIERILLGPRSRETSRVSWPSKDKASALTALRSRASSVHSSSIRLPGQNPIPIRSPIPDRDRDGGRNPFQTRTRSQRRARTS